MQEPKPLEKAPRIASKLHSLKIVDSSDGDGKIINIAKTVVLQDADAEAQARLHAAGVDGLSPATSPRYQKPIHQ